MSKRGEVNSKSSSIELPVLNGLLKLYRIEGDSLQELIDFVLLEGMRLTKSRFGYIAFLSDDESSINQMVWNPSEDSKNSIISQERIAVPVQKAYFLKEAIKRRKPVLCNTYEDKTVSQWSFQAKWPVIKRSINVPLIDEKRIAIVIGVGNKRSDYTQDDLYQITLLIKGLWQLVQRKKYEETSDKLAAIIAASGDAIIDSTIHGIITSWNAGAEKIFGYDPKEVIGKSLKLLNHPEFPNELPLLFDMIKRGDRIDHYETIRMRKDGTPVDISISIAPIENHEGVIIGASILARDITDRKKSEKRLRESEDRYRVIFENTGTGSMIILEDTTVKLVNREFEILTGYSKDEVEEKMSFTQLISERDTPRMLEYHKQRRMSPEHAPHNYEFLLKTKEGILKDMYITVDMIPGTGESIASFMDISEIKRLQREVIKVSERERRHLGQDLHDGLEHHLTSIAFLAKTLSRKLKEKGWEETSSIEKIVTLADDSLRQTEDVVKGLNPVGLETNDLISVVEELIRSFRTTYEITIALSYDKHLYINNNIVANHLFFIIEEALINAVKHAEPNTIEITLTQEGDWITITIKDDGKGIPQLITRQSGVGLQIMAYRASIIGASLDIRPAGDGGTVLVCRFNNRYNISDASDSSFSFKGFSVALENKKKILIVDRHPIVRQGLVDLINRDERLVICGETGNSDEALKIIMKYNPDLVILVLSLESGIGIDMVKGITSRYRLPVIVLSMDDEPIYGVMALRAGAQGFVVKSDGLDIIAEAVHDVLRGKKYLSSRLKDAVMHNLYEESLGERKSPLDVLTGRELEVFNLIGHGYGPRDIARQLGLSVKTVETYRERIKEKLDLTSAAELLQFSIKWLMSSVYHKR